MMDKNLLKLTAEDAALWHKRIRIGRRRREEEFASKARRMLERYKGDWYTDDFDPEQLTSEFIVTNLTNADVKILRSIVLNRNPIVRVEALRYEDVECEELNEAVLNAEWLNLDVKEELDLGALWAIVVGEGWVKVGYQADIVEIERKKKTTKSDTGEDVMVEPGALSVESGEETIVSESGYVIAVNPLELITAPGATRMKNLRWIVQEIYRPRGDTMSDESYTESVRRKVQPAAKLPKRYRDPDDVEDDSMGIGAMGGEGPRSSFDAPAEEYVRELHIWDRRRKMYAVTAEGLEDEWLMSENMGSKWVSDTELPFTRVWFTDVPGEWWCQGDIEMTEGMEHNLNLTTTLQLTGAKRAARHWRVDPGAPQTLKDAFANLQDGDVLEYSKDQAEMVETDALSNEVFAGAQTSMSFIREVRGINEYLRQGTPAGVGTATEASLVAQGSQLANNPRRERIEAAAADIARKLRQIIISHYEDDHVVRMVGQPGEAEWRAWKGKDLEGNYRLYIEVGSSFPLDKASEQQKRLAIYKILSTSQAAPILDQQKVLRWTLDAFDVSLDRFMLPEQIQQEVMSNMAQQDAQRAEAERYGIESQKMEQEASGLGDQQLPNAAAPITGTSRTGDL